MRTSQSQTAEDTENFNASVADQELERKVSKGLQGNQRIDHMFQAMRQKPADTKTLQERAPLVPRRELRGLHDRNQVPSGVECMRKLFEDQTLVGNREFGVVEKNANLNIPEATRLAFCCYNGSWPREYANVSDVIDLNPMFDRDDSHWDEFHVYYKRIIHYLLIRDVNQSRGIKENCLIQSDLKPGVRATLFDWMIKVHQYLRMKTETLHMATNFVDLYMSRRRIESADYQLVGITAIFLAGKVNERVPAHLGTLCYLTENSFTPKQILKFEEKMLSGLDFEMNTEIPHTFLDSALIGCSDLSAEQCTLVRVISLYLFDLGLTEFELARLPASLRNAAAILLARRLIVASSDSSPFDSPTSDYGSSGSLEPASAKPKQQLWTPELCALTGQSNAGKLRSVALLYASALVRVQRLINRLDVSPEIARDVMDGAVEEESGVLLNAAFVKYSSRRYLKIAHNPLLTSIHYASLLKEWNSGE